MPYKIKKIGKNKAEVINTDTGKSHGVTTLKKAKSQMRLLYAVEKDPNFAKASYNKKRK